MTGNEPTLEALAEIASRATTLDERIAMLARRQPQSGETPAETALLDVWAKNIARGSRELLSRRLAWDGLDLDRASSALLPPAMAVDQLPSWLRVLEEAYGWGRAEKSTSRDRNDGPFAVDSEHPLPFQELLLPLIEYARGKLAADTGPQHRGLGQRAHRAFEQSLLRQLTRICAQALYLAFARFCAGDAEQRAAAPRSGDGPSRVRYLAFLARMTGGGLLAFFREHSVAARLCVTATQNWVGFVSQFLVHLDADRPQLEQRFAEQNPLGPVVSVDLELSDAHDGGKSVVICHFDNGRRLVYKPRPLALEEFFAELVRWANDAHSGLPLCSPLVLSLPTHGWVEWIAPRACTDEAEIQRFYRRCGMLLAVLHGVQGSDVHSGNLIANGEYPMLIDAETLLTHRFELEASGEESRPLIIRLHEVSAHETVLRVHMLPWFKAAGAGVSVDLGGINLKAPSASRGVVLDWTDVNTDAIRLAPVPLPIEQPRNLPVLGDQMIGARDYLDEVLAGFSDMYDLLLSRRDTLLAPGGVVDRLGPHPVRFVFRHTSLYAALLERTLHPRYLRDGAVRTIELDVLARPLLEVADRPVVWPLLAVERAALEQMDVPLFSTRADAQSLELPDGHVVPDVFHAAAAAEARRKLLKLSQEDKRQQEDLIRASFAASSASGLMASPSTPVKSVTISSDRSLPELAPGESTDLEDQARREAGRLAEQICERAYLGGEAPLWMAPTYVAEVQRHRAGVGGSVLFDGTAGIALALAAVASVVGRRDFADLARQSLQPLCAGLREVSVRLARGTWDAGLGTGVASCAYGLLRAADLLGASELLDAARAWAALLEPSGLSPTAQDDLLSGRAGAMLLLIRLHAATGEAANLDQALRFADDLMARRRPDPRTGLRVWIGSNGVARAGLAHGQSGIAFALAEAAAATGRAELRMAAEEAVRYEREVLGADLAATEEAEVNAAWSHGSTGIGLARAAMLRSIDDDHTRQDLEAAVRQTQRHLLEGVDDLGSGIQGRIELLFVAADSLARPALRRMARHAAIRTLDRVARSGRYHLGWYGEYQHPGLFQGLGGLAYSWARLANPNVVRNVSLWE